MREIRECIVMSITLLACLILFACICSSPLIIPGSLCVLWLGLMCEANHVFDKGE